MARRPTTVPLIVANWKMQLGMADSHQRLAELKVKLKTLHGRYKIVVCPTALALPGAKKLLRGSPIQLGAQNVSWDDRGALTGETSPLSLVETGVEYVIIGHSERRHLLGETDEMVGRKVVSALAHGLAPIICVGETAHERNDNRHELVVGRQLTAALRTAPPPTINHHITIAYEPVWAIGTGEPASSAEATAMLDVITQLLINRYGLEIVERNFRLLYGGSVAPENVGQYVRAGAFHGALVGGASLEANSLTGLISNITKNFNA